MSRATDETKETPVVRPPVRRGPGSGGPFGGAGMPAEKAMAFWPSAKRLLGTLAPERWGLVWVFLLTVASVVFTVIGPKLLGNGTTLIFEGAISATLPEGVSQQQIIDGLRASGDNQTADLLSGMELTPGTGIDFVALSQVLFWVLALYILASVFGWLQAYVL